MFYIVPAWDNEVKELNRDPLKNLTNLLISGKKDVKITVLNFLPNLRYLLHINGLTNYKYWNIWDEILGIKRVDGIPLGPEALDLPPNIRLINSTYSMDAYDGAKLYARIIRTDEGYISEVRFMESNNQHTDIYDDRGFKVCTNYYENGVMVRREWFNEYNQVIVRYEPNAEIAVQILGNYSNFKKRQYKTLDELLIEFITSFFEEQFNKNEDALIASTNPKIRSLMLETQKQLPVTYLLDHQGPIDQATIKELVPQIEGSLRFVVPNYAIFEQFKVNINEQMQSLLELGYPYGAENRLGNSNEESKLVIYWHVDEATDNATCEQFSKVMFDYHLEHENVAIQVAVLNRNQANIVFSQLCQLLKNKYYFLDFEKDRELVSDVVFGKNANSAMKKLIMQLKFRLLTISNKTNENSKTNPEEIEKDPLVKATNWENVIEDIVGATIYINPRNYEIHQALTKSRIMVDLGKPYNTRMEFNAISAGIPQIVNVDSPFIINKENGWIISDQQSLIQGLDYYLQELGNWNISLVATTKYMEQLTLERQADWWERRTKYEK